MNKKTKGGIILLIITIALLLILAIPIFYLGNGEFVRNNSSIFLIGYIFLYSTIAFIGGISGIISFILIGIGLYQKNVLFMIIYLLILLIILGVIFYILKDSLLFDILSTLILNIIGIII